MVDLGQCHLDLVEELAQPTEGEAGNGGRRHQHGRGGAGVEGVLGAGQSLQLAAGLGQAGAHGAGEPVVLEEEAQGRPALGPRRHGPSERLVGGQRTEHGHPVDHVVGIVAPLELEVLRPDVEDPGGQVGPLEVLADGQERHGFVAAHGAEQDTVDPLATVDHPAEPLDPPLAGSGLVEIVRAGQPQAVAGLPRLPGHDGTGGAEVLPGRGDGRRGSTTGSPRCGGGTR